VLCQKLQVERISQADIYRISEDSRRRNAGVREMMIDFRHLRDKLKSAKVEETEMPAGTSKLTEMIVAANGQVHKVQKEIERRQEENLDTIDGQAHPEAMDLIQSSVLKVLHENSCLQEKLHNMYETVLHVTMRKLREARIATKLASQNVAAKKKGGKAPA
jgi:hypothetical protein